MGEYTKLRAKVEDFAKGQMSLQDKVVDELKNKFIKKIVSEWISGFS